MSRRCPAPLLSLLPPFYPADLPALGYGPEGHGGLCEAEGLLVRLSSLCPALPASHCFALLALLCADGPLGATPPRVRDRLPACLQVSWISRVSVMDTAEIASRCRERGPFAEAALTPDEQRLLRNMIARVDRLAQAAADVRRCLRAGWRVLLGRQAAVRR